MSLVIDQTLLTVANPGEHGSPPDFGEYRVRTPRKGVSA